MVATRIRCLRPLCSLLGIVGQTSDSAPGGTAAPNRLFVKGVRLSVSPFSFSPPSDLLCLRPSRSKYNASTMNYYLLVFLLRFDLKSIFKCEMQFEKNAKYSNHVKHWHHFNCRNTLYKLLTTAKIPCINCWQLPHCNLFNCQNNLYKLLTTAKTPCINCWQLPHCNIFNCQNTLCKLLSTAPLQSF